jgi:hypothetical protein
MIVYKMGLYIEYQDICHWKRNKELEFRFSAINPDRCEVGKSSCIITI